MKFCSVKNGIANSSGLISGIYRVPWTSPVRSKGFGMSTSLEEAAFENAVRSYTASLLTDLSEESPESSQGFLFFLLLVLGGLLLFLLALC